MASSRKRPRGSPIVVENTWWEWGIALALYVLIFLFMWEYHRWRGKPYSFFTANKGFGIASALLIAFSLALGPLSRLTGGFRRAIRLRRPLGIIALVLIIPHVGLSLFALPDKFDHVYYAKYWPSILVGGVTALGLLVLAATSWRRALRLLGPTRWKTIQRTGYILLGLTLAHFMLAGKPANWIQWFKTIDRPVPPGTFIPFVFGMLVLALRAVDRTTMGEPVRGWRSRLFGAITFFFLALFVAFVLFLIVGDALYIDRKAVMTVLRAKFIRDALWRSIWTSFATTGLSLLFAIPMGYALSRYRFPGRFLADTIVDLPIVFPPLVAGLTLLVFFSQTSVGRWIQDDLGLEFVFQPKGIVLCQFLVSASFAIRTVKSTFDEVDRRVENVALTLGCTQWGSFFRVSLPLAQNGVIAGGILTWARAFGIFGPLMIFVGAFRGRTEVLSSTIFLEQSVGNLEVALAVALLLIVVALIALVTIRLVGGRALVRL